MSVKYVNTGTITGPGGGGTGNTIAKFTGPSQLGDSRLTDGGSTHILISNITSGLGWSNVLLIPDSTNILAQRNSTTFQTMRIYGTYTDDSNYERLAFRVQDATDILIAAQTAGSGTDNIGITISPAGTGRVVLDADGLSFTGGNAFRVQGAGGVEVMDDSYAAYRPIYTSRVRLDDLAAIRSPVDGIIRLSNNADNAVFTALLLGPYSTSGIALNKSAQVLQFRLGDGSAFSDIQSRQLIVQGDSAGTASMITFTSGENASVARSSGTGTVKFKDATNRDNLGFIKLYAGSSPFYIPVFAAD